MAQHLALYGNVKIPRVYCEECQQWALIIQGKRACCDRLTEAIPTKTKRISQPDVKRQRPRQKDRKRLLETFENGCAYCFQPFGKWVVYHDTEKKLRLTWDHQVPWAYSQNNHGENFLPACQFCNGWKSSRMFRDIEEVQIYVQHKWEAEGTHVQPMLPMPREVLTQPPLETVLLKAVPTPSLADCPSKSVQGGI